MSAYSIILNVTGKNNASSILKNAAKDIGLLKKEANNTSSGVNSAMNKAGKSIGDNITSGSRKAEGALKGLSKTASSTGTNINHSMNGAAEGMAGLTAGIMGGVGAVEIFQKSITGAMQLEQNGILLGAKFGKGATQLQEQIEKVALVTPGDDTVLKNLLTKGAMSGNLTSMAQMTDLAQAYAGYSAGSLAVGKNMGEVQRDLNDYIFTGATGILAMDSIYRDHLGELEQAKTVQERVNILNKLNKEHYNDLLATSDSLSNVWELTKGYISATLNDLGKEMLPTVKDLLKKAIDFNNQTGGWALKLGIVGVAVLGIAAALGPVVWSISQVTGGLKSAAGSAGSLGSKIKDFILPSKKKVKIECDQDDDCKVSCGGKSGKSSKGNTVFGPTPKTAGGGLLGMGTLGSLGLTGIIASIASVGGGYGVQKAGQGLGLSQPKIDLASMSNMMPGSGLMSQAGQILGGKKFNLQDMIMSSLPALNPLNASLKTWGSLKLDFDKYIAPIFKGWKLPNIKLPSMDKIIPPLKWPKINIPKISFPKFKWPNIKLPKWPTLPKFKWPGLPKFKWPSLPRFKWPGLPKFKWPGIPRFNWPKIRLPRFPSIPQLHWPTPGQLLNALTGKGPKGPGNARGPGLSSRIINTARGPIDHLKNAMGGFKYDDYAGHQKSIAQVLATGSGNCVDLTLTQMALGSAMGLNVGMSSTSWLGGNHVMGTIGSTPMDVANHALTGSWSSPPRGPGDNNSNGDTYIINGDVYGWDDFVRKVETANDQIIGHNLTL